MEVAGPNGSGRGTMDRCKDQGLVHYQVLEPSIKGGVAIVVLN